MTLFELAKKHGSDKAEHGYCNFYTQTLPENPKKILEIGVLHGASIRMWKEYFPEAEIHGLDLFIENDIPDIPGVIWHKGHQCDYFLLEELRKHEFDVIVEDASHNSRDQLITFFGLFNGNHYYIEDLQCADEEFYRQGLPLPATAKHIFDQKRFDLVVSYNERSPIVLIQT